MQTTLTILAWALFGYAIFAVGIAVYLAALAAAEASVVAAPACQSGATLAGQIVAVTTGILGLLGGMAAGSVFSLGASLTGDLQQDHGNQYADAAVKKAFREGGITGLTNLTQDGVNAGLAFADRGKGKGMPLKEIDLDADRGKEGGWSLGGGAKVGIGKNEGELATHQVFDKDGDYQGGDIEIKDRYTPNEETGHSVTGGGKLGWQRGEDGKGWRYEGTGGVGYENSVTGDKAGYEATVRNGEKNGFGDWGFDDKFSGVTRFGNAESPGASGLFDDPLDRAQNQEKAQQKKDETPPWDR